MRDKTFHALCAAHALQAIIAKNPQTMAWSDDKVYAQSAMGACLYADSMVAIRKRKRWWSRVFTTPASVNAWLWYLSYADYRKD